MTFSDKSEYVKFRIESAYKTFDAAKVLAENGFGIQRLTDYTILSFML